jgi:hypothetical protein
MPAHASVTEVKPVARLPCQIPGLVILGHCRVGMPDAAVVAKLEDVPGLAGFADILPVTDAVIFSRGSLGTALAPEKVGDRLAAL